MHVLRILLSYPLSTVKKVVSRCFLHRRRCLPALKRSSYLHSVWTTGYQANCAISSLKFGTISLLIQRYVSSFLSHSLTANDVLDQAVPLPGYSSIQEQYGQTKPLWDCVMSSAGIQHTYLSPFPCVLIFLSLSLLLQAAPIFFPSYQKHVDGAVMVNDPSLIALTAAMSTDLLEPVCSQRVHMLSLGTGRTSTFIEGDRHDWGMNLFYIYISIY